MTKILVKILTEIFVIKTLFLKPWVATQEWVAKTMRMGREGL